MIKGLFFILLFLFTGELTAFFMNQIIPGSVIGMIYLFMALYFKLIPADEVRRVANFFTKYMALFFIPASIGIITEWDLIVDHWFTLTSIALVTTIIVIVVVGLIQQHWGKNS